MNRRLTIILAGAIASTFALPLVASADQAILAEDAVLEVDPGEVIHHADVLVMSRTGIPTVGFDGTTGFADSETVVATIALSTQAIDGLGSVELLSSPTINGTTSADWTTDEASQFEFQPAIELRYTAPSAVELGCEDHPGERFMTHLGVSATLAGSAGTMASFSADDFPGVVSFVITCPPSAPSPDAPIVTPPPTNTLPSRDATWPRPDAPLPLLFLAMAAGAGGVVVLPRLAITHRYRR